MHWVLQPAFCFSFGASYLFLAHLGELNQIVRPKQNSHSPLPCHNNWVIEISAGTNFKTKNSVIKRNINIDPSYLCTTWILTIHKARISSKKTLEKMFLDFKKWVKSIQITRVWYILKWNPYKNIQGLNCRTSTFWIAWYCKSPPCNNYYLLLTSYFMFLRRVGRMVVVIMRYGCSFGVPTNTSVTSLKQIILAEFSGE